MIFNRKSLNFWLQKYQKDENPYFKLSTYSQGTHFKKVLTYKIITHKNHLETSGLNCVETPIMSQNSLLHPASTL